MKRFGMVLGVVLMIAYVNSAAAVGRSVLGLLLAPAWALLGYVLPEFHFTDGPWIFRLAAWLLSAFGPSGLVYWLLSLRAIVDRLRSWPPGIKLLCCWCGEAALFSLEAWREVGHRVPVALFAMLLTAWLVPACLFWQEFAWREKRRKAPPGWAEQSPGRHEFWQGLRMAALHVGGFVFEGGWKEPSNDGVFGRKSAVTGEEAGLL